MLVGGRGGNDQRWGSLLSWLLRLCWLLLLLGHIILVSCPLGLVGRSSILNNNMRGWCWRYVLIFIMLSQAGQLSGVSSALAWVGWLIHFLQLRLPSAREVSTSGMSSVGLRVLLFAEQWRHLAKYQCRWLLFFSADYLSIRLSSIISNGRSRRIQVDMSRVVNHYLVDVSCVVQGQVSGEDHFHLVRIEVRRALLQTSESFFICAIA